MKPIKKKILIELAEVQEKTESGIYLQRPTREQTGVVLAIGSEVEDVSVGDKIMFQHGEFQPYGDNQAIIEEKHVIGIFTND